jgi:hypothetical protein
LHDALSAEKTGVAATAIMTDRFVQTAQVMAQVSGMADYPFAVIEHPIANNTQAVLREKAHQALRQCVGHLVQG